MGTPKAAVPSLERLMRDGHEIIAVYTQPDRPSGRGNRINFSPVKECAIANGLPVFQPVKIRTPEALTQFKSFNADAAVVVAFGRILPETFLEAFPNGAINVHFSLLPKYRGAAPVNWAIVNGESETGVTTMQMDAGLDTGPILLQRAAEIRADDTAKDLMDRLAVLGADLLSETIAGLGEIKLMAQDHAKASIAPIMRRHDGLINWNLNAQEISDRVRGFQPFPTAFSVYNGAKLTIWKAFPAVDFELIQARAGEVIVAKGDDLFVNCGNGSVLSIKELQPEGKRRMPTRDFLNGVRLVAGDILGA